MTSGNDQRLDKASGPARRPVTLLIGLLASLALIVSGTGSAAAQNVVGPQPQNLILSDGPRGPTAQTSIGADGLAQLRLMSATGVAAEGGEDLFASRLLAMRADPERGSVADGTPRTDIAQNKQFNDAIKAAERQLGRTLSKDERSAVHREISGQDYGYHDIVDEVLGMFGCGR